MEWVLIVPAVLVAVVVTRYLRRGPRHEERTDQLPDARLRQDAPDVRGAVNKHSWMLGGGSGA